MDNPFEMKSPEFDIKEIAKEALTDPQLKQQVKEIMSDPETLNTFKNFFKGGGRKSRRKRKRKTKKTRKRGGKSECTIYSCGRARMERKLEHNTVILGYDPKEKDTHKSYPSNYTEDEPYTKSNMMQSIKAFGQKPTPENMYKKEYDWFFIKLLINKMSDEELKDLLKNGTFSQAYRFERRKNHLKYVLNGEKGDIQRVIYLKFKPLKGFKGSRPRRPSHHAPVWDSSVGSRRPSHHAPVWDSSVSPRRPSHHAPVLKENEMKRSSSFGGKKRRRTKRRRRRKRKRRTRRKRRK